MSRRAQVRAVVLAVFLLGGALAAQTQPVDVLAYIQPASGITDVTQVRLVVEVSGVRNPQIDDPQIGALENLRMLRNRPSIEQSTSIINGRVSSSYRLSYVLLPEQAGPASIPALKVVVDGKTYTTDPIRFEVGSSPKRPPAAGTATDGSGKTTSDRSSDRTTGGVREAGQTAKIDQAGAKKDAKRSGAVDRDDVPDAGDDDVVARQLREAAENETDPELREKLWLEYKRYKSGKVQAQ